MQADERPLRADARRNRERILEVARQAFATEGLAVPLDEIARRAGVGPGTLYRHFPTKEALFKAVVHERVRLLVEHARAARRSPDAAQALYSVLDAVVTDAEAKSELIDVLVGAGIEVQTEVAAAAADLRHEMAQLLSEAQKSGTVRDDVAAPELMALLGGILLALRHPNGPRLNPQRALAILRDGLRPTEAH
ncbi:helix-turn-helix domain-containing protein [Spirillospora sp. NPDC047279]|uniref:TetR/AcrR family transcriptional regulator n=1 Tax=Spirillospora sp. NPDC047279 TaxID=3155478 RepID=UPI0033DEEBF8